jgi:hypothetical protein
MFIVPLFPELFAKRFLPDWTSHSRGYAHLPPLFARGCTHKNYANLEKNEKQVPCVIS